MANGVAETGPTCIQSWLVPEESNDVRYHLQSAYDCAKTGQNFFTANIKATWHGAIAVAESAFNTLAFPILAGTHFVTHLLSADFKGAFCHLFADVLGIFQSLMFTVIGVMFVAVGVFFPESVYGFIRPADPPVSSELADAQRALAQAQVLARTKEQECAAATIRAATAEQRVADLTAAAAANPADAELQRELDEARLELAAQTEQANGLREEVDRLLETIRELGAGGGAEWESLVDGESDEEGLGSPLHLPVSARRRVDTPRPDLQRLLNESTDEGRAQFGTLVADLADAEADGSLNVSIGGHDITVDRENDEAIALIERLVAESIPVADAEYSIDEEEGEEVELNDFFGGDDPAAVPISMSDSFSDGEGVDGVEGFEFGDAAPLEEGASVYLGSAGIGRAVEELPTDLASLQIRAKTEEQAHLLREIERAFDATQEQSSAERMERCRANLESMKAFVRDLRLCGKGYGETLETELVFRNARNEEQRIPCAMIVDDEVNTQNVSQALGQVDELLRILFATEIFVIGQESYARRANDAQSLASLDDSFEGLGELSFEYDDEADVELPEGAIVNQLTEHEEITKPGIRHGIETWREIVSNGVGERNEMRLSLFLDGLVRAYDARAETTLRAEFEDFRAIEEGSEIVKKIVELLGWLVYEDVEVEAQNDMREYFENVFKPTLNEILDRSDLEGDDLRAQTVLAGLNRVMWEEPRSAAEDAVLVGSLIIGYFSSGAYDKDMMRFQGVRGDFVEGELRTLAEEVTEAQVLQLMQDGPLEAVGLVRDLNENVPEFMRRSQLAKVVEQVRCSANFSGSIAQGTLAMAGKEGDIKMLTSSDVSGADFRAFLRTAEEEGSFIVDRVLDYSVEGYESEVEGNYRLLRLPCGVSYKEEQADFREAFLGELTERGLIPGVAEGVPEQLFDAVMGWHFADGVTSLSDQQEFVLIYHAYLTLCVLSGMDEKVSCLGLGSFEDEGQNGLSGYVLAALIDHISVGADREELQKYAYLGDLEGSVAEKAGDRLGRLTGEDKETALARFNEVFLQEHNVVRREVSVDPKAFASSNVKGADSREELLVALGKTAFGQHYSVLCHKDVMGEAVKVYKCDSVVDQLLILRHFGEDLERRTYDLEAIETGDGIGIENEADLFDWLKSSEAFGNHANNATAAREFLALLLYGGKRELQAQIASQINTKIDGTSYTVGLDETPRLNKVEFTNTQEILFTYFFQYKAGEDVLKRIEGQVVVSGLVFNDETGSLEGNTSLSYRILPDEPAEADA